MSSTATVGVVRECFGGGGRKARARSGIRSNGTIPIGACTLTSLGPVTDESTNVPSTAVVRISQKPSPPSERGQLSMIQSGWRSRSAAAANVQASRAVRESLNLSKARRTRIAVQRGAHAAQLKDEKPGPAQPHQPEGRAQITRMLAKF